jgi:hypothetical protein
MAQDRRRPYAVAFCVNSPRKAHPMRLLSPARAATLVGAGALVTASLALAPTPANAAVLTSPGVVASVSFDSFPSTGSCTTTGSDASQTVPFAADGVARTATTSASATVTRDGDATDATTMTGSATSTVTAQQAGGQLSQVAVNTSYTGSLSSTLGTAQQCDAQLDLGGGAQFAFDLVSPAYVTVTLESHGGIAQAVAGQGLVGSTQIAAAVGAGAHATSTGTVLLPAGINNIGMLVHQDTVVAPTPSSARSSTSGHATMTVTFQTPGIATTATSGDGKKYVAPAAGRNCAANILASTWKSKAGKGDSRTVKKAVFYVNDTKVKSVKKPRKKDVTTLAGLDPEKAAHLEVVIRLAEKGAGKVRVERDYLPCS